MHLLTWGSWKFPDAPRICCLWQFAKVLNFHTTGAMSRLAISEGIVQYRSAWRVFMPSWGTIHSIVCILGTILQTMDCLYLQLPNGNPTLAELNALQREQWGFVYPMTSVACTLSTASCVGYHVDGCIVGTCWELLRLFWDAWRLRDKCSMWYSCNTWGHKTLLTSSTESCFEASYSWGA